MVFTHYNFKNHKDLKFSKKHLKELGMACRKHMASLIENKKCTFYLIYIHVGEVIEHVI